jgi:hypothetical protein
MGRIKMPSGRAFRRENDPAYMQQAKAQQGKNWNMTLDDTVKALKGVEFAYTSPVLRDVVGGIGELGHMMFGGEDEAEPTVEAAAEARTKAKAPAPTPAPPAPTPAPPAAAPTAERITSPTEAEVVSQQLTEAMPTQVGFDQPSVNESGYPIIPDLNVSTKEGTERLLAHAASLGETDPHKVLKLVNTMDESTALKTLYDMQGRVSSGRSQFYYDLLFARSKQAPSPVVPEPTTIGAEERIKAAITPDKRTTEDLQEHLNNMKYHFEKGELTYEGNLFYKLATEELERRGVPIAEQPVQPPVEEPVVAPTPTAEVPTAAVTEAPQPTAAAPYPPPLVPTDPGMSNADTKEMSRQNAIQGISDVAGVRQWLDSLPVNVQDAIISEPDPVAAANAYKQLFDALNLTGAPTAAPTQRTDTRIRIEPDMNLGQAQAMAAQLALSGGSQADLAEMLKDVTNITGVSSVGGGLGRWVAGGRAGGYFMDPGLAAQEVKKAYDTAIKARQAGRSKELMDAYRLSRIYKTGADVQRQTTAEQRAERESKAAETRAQAKEARTEQKFIPELLNLWNKNANAQLKTYQQVRKLFRTGGKKPTLTAADEALLSKYQSQTNAAANSFNNFARNKQEQSANQANALGDAVVKAEGGQFDPTALTKEEIAQIYGGDTAAYKRDKKAYLDKNNDQIVAALQERQAKAAERAAKMAEVTTEMATITAAIRQESLNLKGKPEARAKAQKALEKLNKELVKLQKQLAKLEKQ